MAHSCPECYLTCYCNGDIDECLFDEDENVEACTHCAPDDQNDFDEFDEVA